MHCWIIIVLLTLFNSVNSQTIINLDTLKLPAQTENIFNKALFSDSLTSSFYIIVKHEVKAHKHQYHCEQVLVLEGNAQMKLGEKILNIKKGDLIFIPKNTVHSVKNTGKDPLKVMSIQAPFFDGKDRIMIEEK